MKRNFVETVLGIVVLAIAVLFLVYGSRFSDMQNGGPQGYTITAEFSDIGVLKKGSDVRISGVKVGTVSDLTLNPQTYLARVSMRINSDIELPEDTASRISSEGLLGGAFLALEPGGAEELLTDGGTIYYNQDAQNLERLLGQFIFSMNGDGSKDSEQAE